MIVGTRKSLEELQGMVSGYKKILLSGCDTCVAECASGGRRKCCSLAAALQLAFQLAGKEVVLKESTVDRQCIHEFLLDVVDLAQDYDAVLSLACGAGVQALATKLEKDSGLSGPNTLFIGETAERGLWLENCRGCGDCQLGYTGGICPISRCAKRLLNGPCGGTSSNGLCEINLAKIMILPYHAPGNKSAPVCKTWECRTVCSTSSRAWIGPRARPAAPDGRYVGRTSSRRTALCLKSIISVSTQFPLDLRPWVKARCWTGVKAACAAPAASRRPAPTMPFGTAPSITAA